MRMSEGTDWPFGAMLKSWVELTDLVRVDDVDATVRDAKNEMNAGQTNVRKVMDVMDPRSARASVVCVSDPRQKNRPSRRMSSRQRLHDAKRTEPDSG